MAEPQPLVLAEHALGSIAKLRMPESWACVRDGKGDWRCSDRGGRPGKLVVSSDEYDVDPNATDDDRMSELREILTDMVDKITSSRRKPEVDFQPLDDGVLLQTITDFDEQGDDETDPPIRVITWYHVRLRRGTIVNVSFSLLLPLAEIEAPYYVQLVEALTPAIEAAQIH